MITLIVIISVLTYRAYRFKIKNKQDHEDFEDYLFENPYNAIMLVVGIIALSIASLVFILKNLP